MREIVAAELRTHGVTFPGYTFEGYAEQHFAHAPTIKRGGIDQGHSEVQRNADAGEHLVESDVSKLCAERTGAEAQNGDLKIGFSKAPGLHGELILTGPAADGEEHVAPERLIGGLNRKDVVGAFDVLIKIPLEDGDQRES